ncbi:uroporphyrinogen decarboxylase family protein [uncultured Cohaesibacter sp.]|uniref:uroporphyrinogen decarboxylase family protein n=1 Tax=uncultured Cohaesibacter sp. TaxID=1002546 RepID=UPI0029C8A7F5|nr:uroporphyrinogen decarboxylase family protein [uncultured Cohaesibacter sp.]
MNRMERLQAVVEGKPVDRVPVSAWGHWYMEEQKAESFADKMLSFREEYDWDLIKVHSRASYHVEPFGFQIDPSNDPAIGHGLFHSPVRTVEDWYKLRPQPLENEAFDEQLKVLELIRKGMPKDCPLIFTVFTPLDIADKMLDRHADILFDHIREAPEAVAYGLSVFSETLSRFVRKVTEVGVDGFFFSTKWVNGSKLSVAQYRDLCLAPDLNMMAAAKGLPFNIMHVCQNEVFLNGFHDYPVSIMHWDDNGKHNPSLRMGRQLTGHCAGGGVASATLARGTADEVSQKAVNTILENNGTGMILASGCSIATAKTPAENLKALRKAPQKAAELLEQGKAA